MQTSLEGAATQTSTYSDSSSKPLSLRINFTWMFIANVIYGLSSWGMLVVLAKLGTPESVGQFALGLSVTAPVILFANLQLRSIQATDARREYLFRDYFALRLTMLGLALLAIAGIAILSGYSGEVALTIIVIGLGKTVDAVSDVIYGALQQRERMNRIGISYILKGILSLGLLAAAQYLTHSVLWAALGWTAASVIVVLFYDLRSIRLALRRSDLDGLMPRFDGRILRKLTLLSLPLGLTMLLISLNTNIPRYFVERYAGVGGLGIFAAVAYIMTAGSTFVSALGQAATPKLANLYADRNRGGFIKLLLKLVAIGAVLGVGGIMVAVLVGRPLLTALYKPEYAERMDVFVWLMVAAALSYITSFLGDAVTAARHFKAQPLIFTVCAACTVLLCAVLVPDYGVLGAAWAITSVTAVQLALILAYMIYALRQVGQVVLP